MSSQRRQAALGIWSQFRAYRRGVTRLAALVPLLLLLTQAAPARAAAVHPGFLLHQSEIDQLKVRVAEPGELQARWLRVKALADATVASDNLFADWRDRPYTSGYVGHPMSALGLAYALTGDVRYARKAAAILLSFQAAGGMRDEPGPVNGSGYSGHAYPFPPTFLFTYDLIYHSGALSDTDKQKLETWFRELTGFWLAQAVWKGRYVDNPSLHEQSKYGWESWIFANGYDSCYVVPELQVPLFYVGMVGFLLDDPALISFSVDGNDYPFGVYHHGQEPLLGQNPYSFHHFLHDAVWPTGGSIRWLAREGSFDYYAAQIFGAELLAEAAWHRGVDLWKYRDPQGDGNLQTLLDWTARSVSVQSYYMQGRGPGFFDYSFLFALPHSHYQDDISGKVLAYQWDATAGSAVRREPPAALPTGGRRRYWGDALYFGDVLYLLAAVDRSSPKVEAAHLEPLLQAPTNVARTADPSDTACFEVIAEPAFVAPGDPVQVTVRALTKEGRPAPTFTGQVKLWVPNWSPAFQDYTGGRPRDPEYFYQYADMYSPRETVWDPAMEPDLPAPLDFTTADQGVKTATVRLKNGGVGVSYRLEAIALKPENRGYLAGDVTRLRGWSNRIFVGRAELVSPPLPPAGTAFLQSPDKVGLVSIEAEHFDARLDRAGHSWEKTADPQASGGAVVKPLPETGAQIDARYATESAGLSYQVYFRKAGTHYLWIRGSASGSWRSSCHSGLDGKENWQSSEITGFAHDGSLSWAHASQQYHVPTTFQVDSPGLHTVNLWMNTDDLAVDKIVITTDRFYPIEGEGPPESAR